MLEPRGDGRVAHGVTLIELLVALVIIGITFGVAAFTLGPRSRPQPPSVGEQIAALRASAADSGKMRTAVIATDSGAILVTAFPDGRVLTSGHSSDSGNLVEAVHAR